MGGGGGGANSRRIRFQLNQSYDQKNERAAHHGTTPLTTDVNVCWFQRGVVWRCVAVLARAISTLAPAGGLLHLWQGVSRLARYARACNVEKRVNFCFELVFRLFRVISGRRFPCRSSEGCETFEFRDIVACNILQRSATSCNNFYFWKIGVFELPEFIFGIGFALFLRDSGISVERAEILYSLFGVTFAQLFITNDRVMSDQKRGKGESKRYLTFNSIHILCIWCHFFSWC